MTIKWEVNLIKGCVNPLIFLQRFLLESIDSLPFSVLPIFNETWILAALLARIFAEKNSKTLIKFLASLTSRSQPRAQWTSVKWSEWCVLQQLYRDLFDSDKVQSIVREPLPYSMSDSFCESDYFLKNIMSHKGLSWGSLHLHLFVPLCICYLGKSFNLLETKAQ